MLKKTSFRTILSTLVGVSAAALGAAAATGCAADEGTPQPVRNCPTLDGLWDFTDCTNIGSFFFIGPAPHGACYTPDNLWYRAECSDPATGQYLGEGPAPAVVTVNPGVVTPVSPANTVTPAVTPTGVNPVAATVNPNTDTTVAPAVNPGVDTTMPATTADTAAVNPANTTAANTTADTAAVSPVDTTAVTPDTTAAVSPDTTAAVSPDTTAAVSPDTTSDVSPAVSPGGADPAGYWRQDAWQGCVWTGVDDKGVGSNISPQDFVAGLTDGAYCVSGTVGAEEEYQGVALLGFNLAEPADGTSCVYTPVDPNAEGPPAVQLSDTGVAVNFANNEGTTLRIQLQGPNGAKNDAAGKADRWCYTIVEPQGPVFVEYSKFHNQCWVAEDERSAIDNGDPANYWNGEAVSAVVFTVPGNNTTDTPFDFCVNGFAGGTSVADAPTGGVVAVQAGTVGYAEEGGDYDRKSVIVDGEKYIIQNNNWGNESGELILSYSDNSFKLTSGSGSRSDHVPVSFPSIYIGANGFTNNGAWDTRTTDNLPARISEITSIDTSFAWSGSTSVFNATYDVWFANSIPTQEYRDGIDGFLMVWLYEPAGEQPIGSNVGSVTIAGQSWNIWQGPRGEGPEGFNDAPVVSYVNPSEGSSDRRSMTFNLKDFFDDAVSRGYLNSNMYLTDVFAGFEIWNGGAGGNLAVDSFTCKVNK